MPDLFKCNFRFSFSLFIVLFYSVNANANDSDIVNCNHAWKIVILGSSTSYGSGASTYDSSWAGKYALYLGSKNSLNEVYNFGIPGFNTYQNLRPDGYIPPAGRPYPASGYNITAALDLHPDAIIINMPSNDGVNLFSQDEQHANFEATMHLADSANVPVWVTTTQPRNNLSADQINNIMQARDWILARFGNKAVDFWNSVANPDGTINSTYAYDNVHVNNLGHDLFFKRMRAAGVLDMLCNRLIPPCSFTVADLITGNTNACGNMGIGDSAVYSIASQNASNYTWTVSNPATMGLSAESNGSSVKIKYASAFTGGTVYLSVTGCNDTIVSRSLTISKAIPGMPSGISGIAGSPAVTFICPFIGGLNLTYVAIPPASNAGSVIAYRWTIPVGAQLVSVNRPDSSSITINFPTTPSSLTLSVAAVSGCGVSSTRSINLNKTAPSAPSSITGPTDVCALIANNQQSGNVTYTVSAVNNASSYLWSVPAGATLVSGQGTTSVNIVFSSSFTSGSINVQSISPCGNSINRSMTVYKRVAAAPSVIQKEFSPVSVPAVTNVCGSASEIYRIRKVNYATSYIWTLKNGTKATIDHVNQIGSNDTSVIVTFLSGFTKDTLTVASVSACNISAVKSINLSASLLPPNPSNITSGTGNFVPCVESQVTYTAVVPSPTSSQTAASVYRWTTPANTIITSAAADSSSVTLQFNAGYNGGTISVRGQSLCGQLSSIKSVTLKYSTPTPSSILSGSGDFNPCEGNQVTYNVTAPLPTSTQVAAAVYRWSIPTNTVIIASNSDSSSVILQYNSGYNGGSLSVKGQTVCGVQGSSKFVTLKYYPPTPTGINSSTGIFNACAGETITYSVNVPSPSLSQVAAIRYRWTRPDFTTILNANSDSSSIDLMFNEGYSGGRLSVKGETLCGVAGISKIQLLTHTDCASGKLNLTNKMQEGNRNQLSVFPNPSNGDFIINTGNISLESKTLINIHDVQGRKIIVPLSKTNIRKNQISFHDLHLSSGVYFLTLQNGVDREVVKIVVENER